MIRESRPSCLRAAAKGIVPLHDKCIAVQPLGEDQAERAKRQHAARSFRMWPTPDGMVEGHFKVTPEVGGAIKAAIDDGSTDAPSAMLAKPSPPNHRTPTRPTHSPRHC